jgi:hypothetical protein
VPFPAPTPETPNKRGAHAKLIALDLFETVIREGANNSTRGRARSPFDFRISESQLFSISAFWISLLPYTSTFPTRRAGAD